jgi:hypothetical protein
LPNFDHLQRHDPRGRTSTYRLPIDGYTDPATGEYTPAELDLRHAGESNRAWHNASTKFNAKHGLARKSLQGRPEADTLSKQRDLELFPRYVVTGWRGITDSAGQPVPLSEDNCRSFLTALPLWIFDEVRIHAMTASNFQADDVPTADEVQETAGN